MFWLDNLLRTKSTVIAGFVKIDLNSNLLVITSTRVKPNALSLYFALCNFATTQWL